MSCLKVVTVSLLFLFFVGCTSAQYMSKDELIVMKGQKYISHQIKTGETLYSISKKYKVGRELLEKHNPKVKDSFSIGDMLKIPYVEGVELDVSKNIDKGEPDGFEIYKIKKRRETLYSIAKKFDITVEELHQYNPDIRKYKRGVKVKIPYWKEEIVTEQDSVVPKEVKLHQVISGETLYSISKEYGISKEDILAQNPNATDLKAGMTIFIPVLAKEEKQEEVVGNYFEHTIVAGETLWRITKRYGVDEQKLKALNPVLETGFPTGAVLKIPIPEINQAEENFKKHAVQKGETLYGLSKRYIVSIPELKKYNPVLQNRNLLLGDTILIPQKSMAILGQIDSSDSADSTKLIDEYHKLKLLKEIPQECIEINSEYSKSKSYKVALFLPLFLDENYDLNHVGNSASGGEPRENFKSFYRSSENFMQFYEGVLLAIQSIKRAGFKVQLNVFDTKQSLTAIRKHIFNDNFLATDLIIGPVYGREQKEVAQIAAKNHIPFVSPLTAEGKITLSNPSYFQVNPSRNYIASATADMISEEYSNSNFIVVKMRAYQAAPERYLIELLSNKFVASDYNPENKNFTIYNFEQNGIEGLRSILSSEKENVIYIPSTDEGSLNVAVSNINNLSQDFSITLIGSNKYPDYASIPVDQFHNLKLKYVAPYWTDYNKPSTIKFVKDFKYNFGTEPNKFSMQGYDVALYFITALTRFGKDFGSCLPYFNIEQVQGNYRFDKMTQFGGYMNKGVSVVSYTQEYEIEQTRIKGQPPVSKFTK